MSARQVFRRPVQIAFGAVGFGVFLLIGVAAISDMVSAKLWIGLALAVLFTAFVGYIEFRILRLGVVANSKGLVVRNYFRQRRISWSEVVRISPAHEDPLRCVGVVLRDGTRVRCSGLAPGRFESASRADRLEQRLADRLAAECDGGATGRA